MLKYLVDKKFIGDLSLEDADILAKYASQSSSILEFGAGGSTQILAQCGANKIISVETSQDWIDLTQKRLAQLTNATPVEFCSYTTNFPYEFDMIFVDGVYQLRLEFALATWYNLKVGGVMLFHDTRRWWDIEYALNTAQKFSNQVEQIDVNARASNGKSSNITVLHKKEEEPYVNWNLLENKPSWAYGAEPNTEDKPLWSYNEGI